MRAVLEAAGERRGKVFLVGGVPRDLALARALSGDYDFAVEGGGGMVEALARSVADGLGGTPFVLDSGAPSWRVAVKDPPATVDFSPLKGSDITEDLALRDFTVNSIAVPLADIFDSESPVVLDPAGGLADAGGKVLRVTSERAFDDDPLRCLRAVRLAQGLSLEIDSSTERLAASKAELVKRVSPERVRDELVMIFTNPGTARAFARLMGMGLAGSIWPELSGWGDIGDYDLMAHTLKTVEEAEDAAEDAASGRLVPGWGMEFSTLLNESVGGVPRGAVLRLAALFHDAGKALTISREEGRLRFTGHDREGALETGRILRRTRFSRKAAGSVVNLVRNHHRLFTLARLTRPTPRARAQYFRKAGGPDGLILMLLSVADARATRGGEDRSLVELVREMADFYYRVYSVEKPPPVMDGRDIMEAFGVEEGPAVGRIMERISEGVEAGEVSTREDAVGYVKRWLDRGGGGGL